MEDLGKDIVDVINLLNGVIPALLNVGQKPQASAGPGPSPPAPTCLTTKQITDILTKIINEINPILKTIENSPLLKDALAGDVAQLNAAVAQIVFTLDKIIAEILNLTCQVYVLRNMQPKKWKKTDDFSDRSVKDVESLLTKLGLGAISTALQNLIPL